MKLATVFLIALISVVYDFSYQANATGSEVEDMKIFDQQMANTNNLGDIDIPAEGDAISPIDPLHDQVLVDSQDDSQRDKRKALFKIVIGKGGGYGRRGGWGRGYGGGYGGHRGGYRGGYGGHRGGYGGYGHRHGGYGGGYRRGWGWGR